MGSLVAYVFFFWQNQEVSISEQTPSSKQLDENRVFQTSNPLPVTTKSP